MISRSRWRQRMLLAPLLVLIFQQVVYIRISFRPVSCPPPKEGKKFALLPPEPNRTASNLSLSYNQTTNVVIAPIQNSKHKDAGSYYDSILSPSGHLRCWNPHLRCQILREANAASEDAVRIRDSANDTSITGPKSLALVDPMLQDGKIFQLQLHMQIRIAFFTRLPMILLHRIARRLPQPVHALRGSNCVCSY